MEFTGQLHATAGFSAYANIACSVAQGEDWTSAQFLFEPGDAELRQKSLDLSRPRQTVHRLVRRVLHLEGIGSATSTLVYLDAIYGSGLRQDGGRDSGRPQ